MMHADGFFSSSFFLTSFSYREWQRTCKSIFQTNFPIFFCFFFFFVLLVVGGVVSCHVSPSRGS